MEILGPTGPARHCSPRGGAQTDFFPSRYQTREVSPLTLPAGAGAGNADTRYALFWRRHGCYRRPLQ